MPRNPYPLEIPILNTLGEGLYWASDGSTIVVFAGTYPQNLTFDRPMTIIAKDGIARIGQ